VNGGPIFVHDMSAIGLRSSAVSVPLGAGSAQPDARISLSYRLEGRGEQLRQAFEVQDPADQVGFLSDPFARSRKTTTELAIQSVALSRCAS